MHSGFYVINKSQRIRGVLLSAASIDARARALYYEAKTRGCAVRVLAKTRECVCWWRRSWNEPKSYVHWYKIRIILICYLRLIFRIILVPLQLTVYCYAACRTSLDLTPAERRCWVPCENAAVEERIFLSDSDKDQIKNSICLCEFERQDKRCIGFLAYRACIFELFLGIWSLKILVDKNLS